MKKQIKKVEKSPPPLNAKQLNEKWFKTLDNNDDNLITFDNKVAMIRPIFEVF